MHRRDPLRNERGDTIIEVLLAIGVLAILITTTYTVMSRSLAMTYNALDRTNTQAVVNGQVNMLRAAHAAYTTPGADETQKQKWRDIVAMVKNTAAETPTEKNNRNDGCKFGVNLPNAFYLDPVSAAIVPVTNPTNNIRQPTVGATPVPGQGLWIEGYEMTRDALNAVVDNVYTFYVKGCTVPIYGDGSDVLRETKTAVRLYAAP